MDLKLQDSQILYPKIFEEVGRQGMVPLTNLPHPCSSSRKICRTVAKGLTLLPYGTYSLHVTSVAEALIPRVSGSTSILGATTRDCVGAITKLIASEFLRLPTRDTTFLPPPGLKREMVKKDPDLHYNNL